MKKIIIGPQEDEILRISKENDISCDWCDEEKKVFMENDGDRTICFDCIKQLAKLAVTPKKK